MLPFIEPAEMPVDAIEVGRILDAWGIKGWFKIQPYSAEPEALFSSKRWFLQPSERGARGFEGPSLLKIQECKVHSEFVVARAHECTDRNNAELLKGARVFISRQSFPTPNLDEYYWVDLMGLEVFNRELVHLGRVADLMSTGPQTVLVLEKEGVKVSDQCMIPFVSHYIDKVSLDEGKIWVDWQLDY